MHRVALVVHPTTMLLEFSIAAEVFGVDRSDLSLDGEWYRLAVATADGAPSPWAPGTAAMPWHRLDRADSVVVTSTADPAGDVDPDLLAALRAAHAHGVRIASLCTGSFLLAGAGLLDGRTATTHWMHAAALAASFPQVRVRPDVLYTDDGDVLTSAGKTAALDLCLHLVSRDFGTAASNGLARRLVVPAHRPGGQAQFVPPAVVRGSSPGITPTLVWARERIGTPLSVADLARHARLSPRQLARRMASELRTTPLDWLWAQRLAHAQELLERTDSPVEEIAAACGTTPAALRRRFQSGVGVAPARYRDAFRRQ